MDYILAVGTGVFWHNEDSSHEISGLTNWSFVWNDIWTNDTEAFVVGNDGDKTFIVYGERRVKEKNKITVGKENEENIFSSSISLLPLACCSGCADSDVNQTAVLQNEGPANVDDGIFNYGKCVRIDYFIKTSFFISTNFSPSFPSAFMR